MTREQIIADRKAKKAALKRIRARIRNTHPHKRGLEGMSLKEYLVARWEAEMKELQEEVRL